jgi:hypothetical protein
MEARVGGQRHAGARADRESTAHSRSRLERLLGARPEDDTRYLVYRLVLAIGGGGFAAAQPAASFVLPHIPPGQELEEIAT